MTPAFFLPEIFKIPVEGPDEFNQHQPLWSLVGSVMWVLHLSHLYSSSLQDRNLLHAYVHVHSLHPRKMRSVGGVFVVGVDLEVGHGGEVAGFRHHIAAVAHEVVISTIEGEVVRFSPCIAG